MEGQRLTPLGPKRGRKRLYSCICGKEKWIFESNVKRGLTLSCGCYHREQVAKLQKVDLAGRVIGFWVVSSQCRSSNANTQWLCRCRCGRTKWIDYSALSKNRTKSCGLCGTRLKDPKESLSGKTFGRLVVQDTWRRSDSGRQAIEWLCICTCVEQTKVWLSTSRLHAGVQSCGCLKTDRIKETQHNRARHKITLNDIDRTALEAERENLMASKSFHDSRIYQRYKVVAVTLLSDRNREGGSLDDNEIAKRLEITPSNVSNIRCRAADPNFQKRINKRAVERWANDQSYRLQKIISHQIRISLGKNISKWKILGKKKTDIHRICGCSLDFLREHLEGQFQLGMYWENYGSSPNGRAVWHIDHIRPRASFRFENPSHVLECFNWKNLRPIWGQDNVKKSSYYRGHYWRNGKTFKPNRTKQFNNSSIS